MTDCFRGRGAAQNPANRFDRIVLEKDPQWDDTQDPSPKTEFFADDSQSILTRNDSPDVGFSCGINPYRGCEHGCIYCYARPNHEYFGLSSGLDFETKIFVKMKAPELLRREFSSPKWKPQVVALSGITDCYQPVERRLQLTRRCLEVLLEFRNPVSIITKNRLVTRDIDILKELARYQAVCVFVSVTTIDCHLSGRMEPRASRPLDRLCAVEQLAKAGIPVGVLVAPVIPALTDHEIPSIIFESAKRGAQWASYTILRLPFAVKELFEDWLYRHFPERRKKILSRIRSLRAGKLNDPNFHSRMRGHGPFAEQIENLFRVSCQKAKMNLKNPVLSTASFQKPPSAQLTFCFDGCLKNS